MRFCSALLLVLVACSKPAVSPDGIVLGTPHPLLRVVAPQLGGVDLEGHQIAPDTVDGRVAVVRFWATWSPRARESIVSFARLYDRYGSEGVRFVAVSVDGDAPAPDEVVRVVGARFTLAWDPTRDVARRWEVGHVPSTFLIDRVGIVRAVFTGDDSVRDEAAIERDLEILLGRSVSSDDKKSEPREGSPATR
jgi:peroxiredoxin